MPKAKSTTPRLTAQRKLELYRATRAPEAPIGELLRQAGVHLDDLREIEQAIESAGLAALKVKGRHGRLPTDVSPERVLQLEQELQEKTTALAELSVAYTLLEKKDRMDLPTSRPANGSRRRRNR
jgi:transposase-like protein